MRSIIDVRLCLAWLQAACCWVPCASSATQSATEAAPAADARPLGGGGSGVLEPVPPPAAPRQQRKVYVCRDAGTPVFTDRPCGPAAAFHEIRFSLPVSGGAVSLSPQPPAASTRPRVLPAPATDAVTPAQAQCTALRERLAAIDDQMRSGYSAREAARLWQRWRDARARLRAQRC
jgi:hypothetical protein